MPPATAWGWNPQLLAAGSAYATYSAEATKVRKATCGGTPLSRTAPGRRQLLVEAVFVFHAGPGLPFFAR